MIALLLTIQLISAYQFSSTRTRCSLIMKGKGSKIPINQRGEYMKQQKNLITRNQQGVKPENVPVFKIFVRPKTGGIWIPCGDLSGDNRATQLVNAWTSGFLEGTYKTELDRGVARSLFAQEDAFAKSIIDNFKPFRKTKKENLEFGYKIEFKGVEEKFGDLKITLLEKNMTKNWFDSMKDSFRDAFGNLFQPTSDSSDEEIVKPSKLK